MTSCIIIGHPAMVSFAFPNWLSCHRLSFGCDADGKGKKMFTTFFYEQLPCSQECSDRNSSL
jgi:hypothetical protein